MICLSNTIFHVFLVFFLLVSTTRILGKDRDEPYDISLRSGLSFGQIKIESQKKSGLDVTKEEVYELNAIPIYFLFHFDILERFTMNLGPGILVDARNNVILRQTIEWGGLFHVLGGARRLSRSGDAFSIVATSPWNLSLGIKIGLNNYGTRIYSLEFSGSAFETKIGTEYRMDVSQDHALGVEMYHSILTMPAGVTRIRYQATEILGFWRTFF